MQNKKLNFGCGDKIYEGYDNIDHQEGEGIDQSFDFNKFPYPIESDTYDYIYLRQVLEHLITLRKVLEHLITPRKVLHELYRIARHDGIIRIEVPYYNNKGAYNDMEHHHFFTDLCFKYFVENAGRINKNKKKFVIEELELTPTIVGKFMPKYIREKLSLFIGGLISQVHVELRVIK